LTYGVPYGTIYLVKGKGVNNMTQKIKKLIASIRKNRKLQAKRKQLWQDILIIHHMFD